MIIEPQGLLKGDRIRACSDTAQLHYPRLLAASNTYGRFRMSVEWLQTEVYGSFKVKPSKAELTAWLREYHDNFLLFVWQAADGAVWAQWEIPEKLMGRYRATADRKLPSPPEAEHMAYRRTYAEKIKARNMASDDFCETFQNIPKSSTDLQNIPHHVGVGVVVGKGVGVGEILASSTPHEVRHKPFKDALRDWWSASVIPGDKPAWDGSEAKCLDELLKANPAFTLERFERCLAHRAKSEVNLTERPRKWLKNITEYELGPIDAYGKPLARRLAPEVVQASRRTPDAQETAQALQRQDAERAAALASWRDLRQREPDEYAKDAPGWVRQALDVEERAA